MSMITEQELKAFMETTEIKDYEKEDEPFVCSISSVDFYDPKGDIKYLLELLERVNDDEGGLDHESLMAFTRIEGYARTGARVIEGVKATGDKS